MTNKACNGCYFRLRPTSPLISTLSILILYIILRRRILLYLTVSKYVFISIHNVRVFNISLNVEMFILVFVLILSILILKY